MSCPQPQPSQALACYREVLRYWLSRLDIAVPSRYRNSKGVQVSLTKKEMEAAYNRRREHMLGQNRLCKWARGSEGGLSPRLEEACPPSQQAAYAFWHWTEFGPEDELSLPDAALEGLKSAIFVGKLDVTLLSYQKIVLPKGVNCKAKDARELLPWSVCQRALVGNIDVSIVSDYVRLLAIQHHGTGWFIDLDTVWLRDAPQVEWAAPCHGHLFSSMESGTTRQSEHHWQMEYLKTPGVPLSRP